MRDRFARSVTTLREPNSVVHASPTALIAMACARLQSAPLRSAELEICNVSGIAKAL
jgi:hypothetical protein